jgi:valyl-tRNA synthetase
VELVKGAFDDETKAVAAWAFDQILVMLHPLMPFVTEELWNAMGERPYESIVAKWPEPEASVDPAAKAELEWLIHLISEIRSARTEVNVPPGARTELLVLASEEEVAAGSVVSRLNNNRLMLHRLARLDHVTVFNSGTRIDLSSGHWLDRTSHDTTARTPGIQLAVENVTYMLPLEGIIDLDAEKSRLSKAAKAAEKERDNLAARLDNRSFTERAKPEAVEKARADHEARSAEADRLRAALDRLG